MWCQGVSCVPCKHLTSLLSLHFKIWERECGGGHGLFLAIPLYSSIVRPGGAWRTICSTRDQSKVWESRCLNPCQLSVVSEAISEVTHSKETRVLYPC